MTDTLKRKLALFDPDRPLDRAATIPSIWYTDSEIHEAERSAVFGGTWQLVGRADQLAEVGSFITANIAGEPILVARTGAEDVRAFYNVCRHRAASVVEQPSGKATRWRCPYHGWTYDLNGRLIGTPEFDGVSDFCRDDNGLVPVAVAIWGPFVWVNLSRDPIPVADYLRPLVEQAPALALESLHFVERREYVLECNWKVFVDNYLDGGYHVNYVHPGLAGVLDYSKYRTEIAGNSAVQISAMRNADSTTATAGPPSGSGVSTVRSGDTAYYWWIFPNVMLNAYCGVMDTNLVLPLGPSRCRVIFDFYFANTEGPAARTFMSQSIDVAEQIQREDISICESVQVGLLSRSYSAGRFSVRREAAGYHFHQLLARYLSGHDAT